MAQVKKEFVRSAILEAAFPLLAERGYAAATMAQIAKRAGVSYANVYIYFESKLAVFFAVYESWLKEKMLALQADVLKQRGERKRLIRLVSGLLRDLPHADDGFSSNMIQAISSATQEDRYSPELWNWFRSSLTAFLREIAPQAAADTARSQRFVRMLILLFDGCSANYRITPGQYLPEKTVVELVDMFLE